jgi:membrane associated rhomboid family serine protease
MGFFIGGIQGNMLSGLSRTIRGINNTVAIGASTCICSILGLQLVLMYLSSNTVSSNYIIKKKISFILIYLFVISMLPGIDFFGHFGSLISGVLIALSFDLLK